MKTIKLIGMAAGDPSPLDGHYVVEYDASRPPGPGSYPHLVCHMVTTPDQAKATRFTPSEAFELWRSVDRREPVRGDGKPNRPMTAFTVAIEEVIA